ncbi:MAG: 2-oxo acid dehydrogenase subunit E2 [Anaerolineales bacterium]|nr:2-oxo acid dehydrogenase subunit E2 [Anaerolineales bacterium]
MPIQVLMPQLGESVVEGTITKWLKAKGERVEQYEALIEVNTDKVDTEVPSPATGVLLEILVDEGAVVQAGQLLAWIGQAGEALPAGELSLAAGAAAPEQPVADAGAAAAEMGAPAAVVTPGRAGDLGFISPVVARIASERGVDLRQVEGSGQGGRITKKDVLAYLEKRESDRPLAPTPPPAPRPVAPLAMEGELLPFTAVRRAIAEHMLLSKRTSPHVTTVMEADLSRVIAHRQANKQIFANDGVNLTYTAYFVAAATAALKAYPIVNSSWSEQGVLLRRSINIGVAASLGEEGLIVPVIKGADGLSLLGLARAVNDLAQRARAHRLQPDEVQGGTFTITNHGVSGSLFAAPIINQPQAAIMGVGAIQKRVVVLSDPAQGDLIAIRPMAYLTLTFDHRILDGAIADYFLARVIETLQNWN